MKDNTFAVLLSL